MTVFAKVFDSLAGRMKQRKATAHERIEAAAKQIAAGNNVDVPGLEDALFTVGISLDDFRGLCDLFAGRVAKFALLETLGAARKGREDRPGDRGRQQSPRRGGRKLPSLLHGPPRPGRPSRQGSQRRPRCSRVDPRHRELPAVTPRRLPGGPRRGGGLAVRRQQRPTGCSTTLRRDQERTGMARSVV